MKLVNLTPHAINLMPDGADGHIITILPSGTVARCNTRRAQTGAIVVAGLPEPQKDVYYIVSSLVAQAVLWKRDDVLIVDDTVRDNEGRIIGAQALAQI